MSDRILVISDLHIAPRGPLNNFHAHAALADFLTHVPAASDTLVLAGDVFDFLQVDGRPTRIHPAGTHDFVAEFLADLTQGDDEVEALRGALRAAIERCESTVLLPGNHDADLYAVGAERALRAWLGIETNARFRIDRGSAGLIFERGGRVIRIGHGHGLDPWNAIGPEAFAAAAALDAAPIELPAGSLLVLETLNAYKSQAGFAFVDRLKPEGVGVALLLAYFDPRQARARLGAFARLAVEQLFVQVRLALDGPGVLATHSAPGAPPPAPLARALAELPTELTSARERLALELDDFFDTPAPSAPGTLSGHGGLVRRLIRHFLAYMFRDGFFDPRAPEAHDQALIDTYLTSGHPRTVLVCGHSHAAREWTDDNGHHVYVNTGTWTTLLRGPESGLSDADVRRWLDDLYAGRVLPATRLSYAEVTTDCALLREHRLPSNPSPR